MPFITQWELREFFEANLTIIFKSGNDCFCPIAAFYTQRLWGVSVGMKSVIAEDSVGAQFTERLSAWVIAFINKVDSLFNNELMNSSPFITGLQALGLLNSVLSQGVN